MSLFSKPIATIDVADLQELLDEQAIENVRLEFKREMPSKNELLKKLSSFANTYGGWLLIGAEEDGAGRLNALPGIPPIAGLKQRIVQWCFDNIGPPIDIEVSDPIQMDDSSDESVYVVFTRESERAPHFLNKRKGIFVRTNEFSQRYEPQLATVDEILRLSDRRKRLTERREALSNRAKERFQSFEERYYSEHGQNPNGLGAFLSMIVTPRYPTESLFDTSRLNTIVQQIQIPWRQVGFPRITLGVVTQHESVLVLRPGSSFSLLEANIWGMTAYASEIEIAIGADRPERRSVGIHLNHFVGQLLVFAEHCCQFLREGGFTGSLSVDVELHRVRGVPWIYFPMQLAEEGPNSTLDDNISINLELTASQLIDERDNFVKRLLREVLFSLNWFELVSTEENLQQLVTAGYEYNFWNVDG
jgi:hypothetical protein